MFGSVWAAWNHVLSYRSSASAHSYGDDQLVNRSLQNYPFVLGRKSRKIVHPHSDDDRITGQRVAVVEGHGQFEEESMLDVVPSSSDSHTHAGHIDLGTDVDGRLPPV